MSYTNSNNTSALFGILEGRRRRVVEEEKRKTAELEARLELEKKKAGLASENDVKLAQMDSNTKMYLILGGVLAFVVGIALYFKFRKK